MPWFAPAFDGLRIAGRAVPPGLMLEYQKSPGRARPAREPLTRVFASNTDPAPSGAAGVRRRGDFWYPSMSPAASPLPRLRNGRQASRVQRPAKARR